MESLRSCSEAVFLHWITFFGQLVIRHMSKRNPITHSCIPCLLASFSVVHTGIPYIPVRMFADIIRLIYILAQSSRGS